MEHLLKKIMWFVVFVLAQALVLNHIHLFHYATPLLLVYFIMRFPLGYPRWGLLLWAFFMGLFTDIFSNTPGVTAGSLTIIGLLQPLIVQLFIPKDDYSASVPSMAAMGLMTFLKYAFTIVLLYVMLFYLFEAFNLFNFGDWILRVVCSTLATVLLIMVFESFRK